jgi:hypothetical protein
MLSQDAYARKLEADLDQIGNGPDAFAQLLAALERLESIEDWQPSVDDWADYHAYLDRLDMKRLNRRFAEEPTFQMTNQERMTAWMARAPLPDDVDQNR